MPQKQLNDTFDLGSDYFSGYLSKTEITDIDQKYISSVIDLDSLSKISRQLTVSMGSMMSLVDGFAILMFVILIYLLSKIIIDKNAQAISMTKILGYTNWEISRLYILSTSIVVVLFLLISLPIESIIMTGLFRAIMITSITGWIPLYMDPVIYVKMFVLGFGTYLIVALLEYRKIKKCLWTRHSKISNNHSNSYLPRYCSASSSSEPDMTTLMGSPSFTDISPSRDFPSI